MIKQQSKDKADNLSQNLTTNNLICLFTEQKQMQWYVRNVCINLTSQHKAEVCNSSSVFELGALRKRCILLGFFLLKDVI
jgi:hypothetical protein